MESSHKKIIGQPDNGILQQLYYDGLINFIYQKHKLCDAQVQKLNSKGLYRYMSTKPPQAWAATDKLIHRWLSTHKFLHQQYRKMNNLCPRCTKHPEDTTHIYQCQDQSSVTACQDILYKALSLLEKSNMSQTILQAFKSHLTDLFQLQTRQMNQQDYKPHYD